MSITDNIEALQKTVAEYFSAVHKLHEEMELNDTPGDYEISAKIAKDLVDVRKMLASASSFLENIEVRAHLQRHINYHFRSRLYVIRRNVKVIGTQLTWKELEHISEGPFTWGFSLIDVCRKTHDSKNKFENSDRPNVRGWRKGGHVWEIWAYSPEKDAWSLVE